MISVNVRANISKNLHIQNVFFVCVSVNITIANHEAFENVWMLVTVLKTASQRIEWQCRKSGRAAQYSCQVAVDNADAAAACCIK